MKGLKKAIIKQEIPNFKNPKVEGVKFPCSQCEYKATEKGKLLRHIKSIHEGVKFP